MKRKVMDRARRGTLAPQSIKSETTILETSQQTSRLVFSASSIGPKFC